MQHTDLPDRGEFAHWQVDNFLKAIRSVKTMGATGDGSTDDTAAIQAAIDAGGTLYFPPATGYRVTSPITVPAGVDVIMEAPLIYAGADGETALTVGQNADNNYYRRIDVWVERATQADWTDEADIGVKLINCHACDIRVRYVQGFTIGVQCMGHGHGWAYNNVSLGRFVDNMYALDLDTEAEGATEGWTNQNTFIGGSFKHGDVTGKSRYGVRITSHTTSLLRCCDNVFLNPSFELSATKAGAGNDSLPVLMEYGRKNVFAHCRMEDCGTLFARLNNTSEQNDFGVRWATNGGVGIDEVNVEDNNADGSHLLTNKLETNYGPYWIREDADYIHFYNRGGKHFRFMADASTTAGVLTDTGVFTVTTLDGNVDAETVVASTRLDIPGSGGTPRRLYYNDTSGNLIIANAAGQTIHQYAPIP